MSELFTIENIMFTVWILTVIFGVYLYFRKPQEDLETKQALTDKDMSNKVSLLAQKETENKTSLLAQQVQWEKEANAQRFTEMQSNIKDAFALAQNHIHTVDIKVDSIQVIIEHMGKELVRLTTTIEERIPKK